MKWNMKSYEKLNIVFVYLHVLWPLINVLINDWNMDSQSNISTSSKYFSLGMWIAGLGSAWPWQKHTADNRQRKLISFYECFLICVCRRSSGHRHAAAGAALLRRSAAAALLLLHVLRGPAALLRGVRSQTHEAPAGQWLPVRRSSGLLWALMPTALILYILCTEVYNVVSNVVDRFLFFLGLKNLFRNAMFL